MKYKDKESGIIRTDEEVMREYNEIVHNSSYSDEDISQIGTYTDYLIEFYEVLKNE
jgi:hypothetical protein